MLNVKKIMLVQFQLLKLNKEKDNIFAYQSW